MNWKPVYAEEERQTYDEPGRKAMGSTAQKIMELRDQMGVEEKARFSAQIEAITRPLIGIGERHLELQKLPIGNPDPIPKRRFHKKKTHGKADARALTGPELAQKTLLAEERAERSNSKRRATSPEVLGGGDDDNDVVTVPDTPPRPGGEAQDDTAITVTPLAIRLSPEHRRVTTRPWMASVLSPEHRRVTTRPWMASVLSPEHRRVTTRPWMASVPSTLFSGEENVPPPSTAPPDLQPRARQRKKSGKVRENEEAQKEGYELESRRRK